MLEDDIVTSQDLRDRLYSSLRQTGAVDSLKSQLRNRLVQELKRLGIKDNEDTTSAGRQSSVFLTATNSLVADHLRSCQYDYSFSVFLPECGLSEQKMFNTTDLLQLLKISRNSLLYKNLTNTENSSHGKGFLWQFLNEIAGIHGNPSYDTGVQTDQIGLPPVHSIEEKLKSVDEYYTNYDQSSQLASIEERMMMYRKAVDQQAQSEIRMQVARLKESELARIKADEKEKFWDKLNAAKSEIERDYRVKYNTLIERERNSLEQLQKQQRDAERDSYMQRQNLLSEIESIRQREVDLRRQQETFERERQMSEDMNRKKEESVRRREEFLRRAEMEYDHKLQAEIARYKAEMQSSYMERYKDMEFREMKAKEDGRKLEDELRNINSIKDELREKKLRVQQLETELERSKKDAEAAKKETEMLGEKAKEAGDYQSLKEENVRLKRELTQIRKQLTQTSQSLDIERRRHEELMREMEERQNARPHAEVLFLQRELERVRSQLRQEKVMTEHLRAEMNSHTFDQRDRTRDVRTSFETQAYQQEEMVQEINNLRQQLASTREVLKDQIYRRPASPKSPKSPSISYIPENIPGSDDVTLLSQTDDYSYSGLLSDSKSRLKRLEQEAESLEENYRNFQFRMTSVEAALPPMPHYTPIKLSTDTHFATVTPVTPVRVNIDRPQRVDIPQMYPSNISFLSRHDTPPSRTPAAVEVDPVEHSLPRDSELPQGSTSADSDLNELNRASISEDVAAPKEPLTRPTENTKKEEEALERGQSRLERGLLEDRGRQDTERRPVELERDHGRFERQQTESERDRLDSEKEQSEIKSDNRTSDAAEPQSKPHKEELKTQEPEIDPVMQKYMDLIKQKREAAPLSREVVESDKELSESLEKSKSQDEASDAIFDDW